MIILLLTATFLILWIVYLVCNKNYELDDLIVKSKEWKAMDALRTTQREDAFRKSMEKLEAHQEWARKERNLIRAELGMPLLEKEINPRSEE